MANLHWNNKGNIRDQIQQITPNQLHTIDLFPDSLAGKEGEIDELQASKWHNRLIHGDIHAVLPALLPEFSNSIDLIYIDPPFMTGKDFMNGYRTELAYSDKWNNDLDTYLQWLYEHLHCSICCLPRHGSLYVHLDWHVVHYAKVLLDEVFGFSPGGGGQGFKSEIIWHYQSGGRSQKNYARKHDTILLYAKSAALLFSCRTHWRAARPTETQPYAKAGRRGRTCDLDYSLRRPPL